jgi:hypothetical protein
MGKDTYPGGGTVIQLGKDRTIWGSLDPAESKKRHDPRGRDRRPTEKEIELESQREASQERKILRSFISECVTAYAANKLTITHPAAPMSLRKRIRDSGGNISWLERNRRYQVMFHEAYCRLRNKNIPFDRGWGRAVAGASNAGVKGQSKQFTTKKDLQARKRAATKFAAKTTAREMGNLKRPRIRGRVLSDLS